MTVTVTARQPFYNGNYYATIQAAIEDAHTDGGGWVVVPRGTWLESLTIYDDIHIRGQGIGATIIKLPDSSASGTHVVKTDNYATLAAGSTTGGPTRWSISRLTIDGNKTNNASGGSGLAIYGRNFRLEDIDIKNCHSDGITSKWGTGSSALVSNESMEALVSRLCVHHNDGHGINWDGPHDSQFVNVIVYKNATNGVNITANAVGCQFVNCHSWGTPQDWAWSIAANSCVLNGCFGESSDTGQLLIAGTSVIVVGGRYFMSTATAVIGIQLGNGSSITGCDIDTMISNCTGGAFVFSNDGGANRIRIKVDQASGTVDSGTINSGTFYEPYVGGGVSYTFLGQRSFPVTVRSASTGAFSLNNGSDGTIFTHDATNKLVKYAYATDIIGYSDGFSTIKFRIDGSAGDLTFEGALDHNGTTAGFFGVAPTTRPTALTAAVGGAINSGDATTDTEITNMRTRIGELETKLKALGLLT